MHKLLHNPWTEEGNRKIYQWIDQAQNDGILNPETAIGCQEIADIIDHAELCDTLDDMSRVEAAILLALWVGRANGERLALR